MKTYSLKFTDWLIVLLVVPLMQTLGMSLRILEEGQSQWGPRGKQEEPPIWSLWHETILMGVWYHRRQDVHVMISASRDGELIATIAKIFGYVPVRGSSSKGGKEAAAEMVEFLGEGKRCAITPDGPRGPRRKLKSGVVAIARLSGRPVVPYAFEAEKCWRLKSWDGFIIPKPFSRAVFVYGNPIRVPKEGGEDRVYFDQIQAEMDRVTNEAENYFKAKQA